MDDRTFQELSQEKLTPFHEQMFNHCTSRVKSSRSFMASFYDEWEDRHKTYRSQRAKDKNDEKAYDEGRPAKQVLPVTYAKVNTFKSFVMSLLTQRPRIYELASRGLEDHDYVELAETLLDGDIKRNQFERKLRQHVVDIAKFGLGVLKHSWEDEFVYVPETEAVRTIFGIRLNTTPKVTMKRVLKSQGNVIKTVSPFDFLPDPRFPITEIHRGEFCADETDMSRSELLRKESEKTVAGMKHLPNMSRESAYQYKRWMRRSKINFDAPEKTGDIVRLTEIQIKITPSEFMLADGKPLGEEQYPIMYLVWLGNMNRVLRCEPMGYLHGEFTFEAAQFDEDSHDFVNQSLSDILDRMQETIDWFMNARVESVTRTIDNQLVVDPLGVEMSTIVNRSRVILLKKGAARTGVDRYIKQLQVQDVTTRHMEDIGQIMQFMQQISGVNENAMGQYHSGRRSATEARVVAQGAASRLKEITSSIWAASIEPLGRKMLMNLRQGLSQDNIIRYAGSQWEAKPEAIAQFTADPETLVKDSDFFLYDGTLASEKAYLAQTLRELFEQVIQLGPSGLIQMEVSPKLILDKIYELLGVGPIEQFSLMKDPQTLQLLVQQVIQQTLQQYAQQLPAGDAGGQPVIDA